MLCVFAFGYLKFPSLVRINGDNMHCFGYGSCGCALIRVSDQVLGSNNDLHVHVVWKHSNLVD